MRTLANSRLLGALPPAVLSPLLQVAEERYFSAGSEIFKQGDPGDGVYVVQEGRVELSGALGPAQRQVFARVGPGDLFGEMAVVEDKPRSANAIAATDAAVVFIPRAAMLTAVQQSPELAFGLLREISQRLRDFNRQYLTEVLQAERLAIVGQFARSIIHDLKNPLQVISLSAEVAGMPGVSAETRQHAQSRIRRQADRIGELINEILEFTQGAPTAFEHTPVNYAAFVEQITCELAAEIESKHVTLKLEMPPPAVVVNLNPKRFRRVFHNLVHNATDVMPDGGSIRLRFLTQANEVVTELEDSGPGIAPEIANRLFETFATHGKAHGTGLGLSICKKIVEDHGGRIWARNEPGSGAVFAFKLPFTRWA